jgi:hypothetical protein
MMLLNDQILLLKSLSNKYSNFYNFIKSYKNK